MMKMNDVLTPLQQRLIDRLRDDVNDAENHAWFSCSTVEELLNIISRLYNGYHEQAEMRAEARVDAGWIVAGKLHIRGTEIHAWDVMRRPSGEYFTVVRVRGVDRGIELDGDLTWQCRKAVGIG